ncbi:MAG TPA: hypothetical protein VF498_11245 [Anaerolineales bacterium]
MHRTLVMATERGKLQNLIFDNSALASRRMKSRYLENLLAWGEKLYT